MTVGRLGVMSCVVMSDSGICANCYHSYGELHTCKCRLKLDRESDVVKAMFKKQQRIGFRMGASYAIDISSGVTNERIDSIIQSMEIEWNDTSFKSALGIPKNEEPK